MSFPKRIKSILEVLPIALLFSSCLLENARAPEKQQIIIGSDFLTKNDSALFRPFQERYDINVKIIHLPADSLYIRLKKEQIQSNIDALWLKSSLSFANFSSHKLLTPLDSRFSDLNPDLSGMRKDWTLLTIDPIVTCRKTRFKAINYNDLINLSSWSVLEQDEATLSVFYSSVIFHFGTAKRNEAVDYIRKTRSNYSPQPQSDSLSEPVFIGRLSAANRLGMQSYVPNQYAQGCFYDGHSFAIVRQAKNFDNAVQFLEFSFKDKPNQKIAKYFNIFPIKDPKERSLYSYQNQYPRLHGAAPVKMYRLTRIRKKIIKSIDTLVEKEEMNPD